MTNDERQEIYRRWLLLTSEVDQLTAAKKAATAAGDKVFDEWKSTDREKAFEEADQAGWILADEIDERLKVASEEAPRLHKILVENQFDLGDFQSCAAYGHNIKKPVKVTFLDGRGMTGLIYPYVYDNAQEMYLAVPDGPDYNLDEGWEVLSVVFI